MEIRLAMAKVARYAVGESGDTVEVVERPRGGVSVVIVDGQRHGAAAKRISHQVANRTVSLIGDGARDGAVVRAVHDFLYAQRAGRVTATLTLLSVDIDAQVVLISRNSNSPVLVRTEGVIEVLGDPVEPLGVRPMNKPAISQFPMRKDLLVAAFTDGVLHAGRRVPESSGGLQLEELGRMLKDVDLDELEKGAEDILAYAIAADEGKPRDDMALVLLGLAGSPGVLGSGENPVRRMTLTYPVRRLPR